MKIKLLKGRISGQAALREAAAGSYEQIMGLLGTALRVVYAMEGDGDPWVYCLAVFPDAVVVQKDGVNLKYPYTYDAATNTVTLGQPIEVLESYQPAPAAAGPVAVVTEAACFLEAVKDSAGKIGSKYRVRIIRAGESGNDNYYPDAVLREAAPKFDGARVFVKGDEEHLAGKGKDVRNLIGGISEPRFVEGKGADAGELQGIFTLMEPDGPIGAKIRGAWQSGLTDLFGFSHDSLCRHKPRKQNGRAFREATAFVKVNSVDLIVEPGAGGHIISLTEAQREETMDRETMIRLLEATGALKGKDKDALTIAELSEMLREALAKANTPGATVPGGVTREELQEWQRMVEARAGARTAIGASSLPPRAKDKLVKQFDGLAKFTEAEVTAAIKEESDYLATFTESGKVTGLGEFSRVEAGETRAQKTDKMFDAFFDPANKHHRDAQSFKECYTGVTGDKRVTGRIDDCDQALMREALGSADLPNVLGDSITRRMIALYQRQPSPYGDWKLLTGEPVPLNDFRTNKRTRFGAYGDLPIVLEAGAYTALTSPTDEQATYAPKKRGGTEQVTREMILNDDVGVIRFIPQKIADAAQRTLAKFVFDFLITNPTIYDSIALFHASHNNLGGSALDATQFSAARLAMLKQTELGSGDRLNIAPATVFVPLDLEATANDLFIRNTNLDPTFLQRMAIRVQTIWYATDTNDWVVAADPARVPMIELGFVGGEQNPQLFVQDMPNVGTMFSNDAMTWKVRHEYGGNVLDYRGLWKAVV